MNELNKIIEALLVIASGLEGSNRAKVEHAASVLLEVEVQKSAKEVERRI